MGRTSKRPIQGEEASAVADSVFCAGAEGEMVDEGLVESRMTRHSMPSDNSIYQTEPLAPEGVREETNLHHKLLQRSYQHSPSPLLFP